jgi:hypothetical protein
MITASVVTGEIWQIQEEKASVFGSAYFLTVDYRSILYFLIFSYIIERPIGIGMSLAGDVPVEDYRKVIPKRIGTRCWEICFWNREEINLQHPEFDDSLIPLFKFQP